MKKTVGMLCLFAGMNISHAGTMGAEVESPFSSSIFVAAEGGWTWNTLGGLQVNIVDVGRIFTVKKVDRGSARVSMGVKKYFYNAFAATGEIGYGYYGRTRFNFRQDGPLLSLPDAPDFSQIHVKVTNDGFDALAGFSYTFSQLDVFFKAGAMVQNSRYNPVINLTGVSRGAVFGGVDFDYDRTQVFPEIKLGAAYQVWQNLSFMASWLHVFGSNPHIDPTINPEMPLGTIRVNRQNPILDTFFLGASYAFPI